MNLYEYLEEYKNLTLDLIDKIQKNVEIDSLIEKRDYILESINSLDFDRKEIKNIGNSLNLLKLEEELQSIAQKEKIKIKKQIETLRKTRQVNTNYNSIENKARMFNKSI